MPRTRTAPGPSGPAAHGDLTTRWAKEPALAAVTLGALLGLHRVFSGTHWVGPVLGTAILVQLVCALTRRWIGARLLGGAIDLIAVAAITAWTVVPASTTFGLPLGRTWQVVEASLRGVAGRMQSSTVPVPPDRGFLVLAALGAGIVALAGSWIAFRLDRAMTATLPALGAFVACCCLGTRTGRSRSIALEIVTVTVWLVVDRLDGLSTAAWFGPERRGAMGFVVRASLPAVLVAGVLALAVVPSLHAADGDGPLGWRSGIGGGTRSVESPLVTLSTRLLQEKTTDVFTVRSNVASYWRLTSLDDFDGVEWNARDSYQDVKDHLPGATAVPRGAKTVSEEFDIQGLDSVWLPLAFDPETVTGAGPVAYDPRSGSLLTAHATSNHLDYTITALQYLDTLSARDLSAAPAVKVDAALTPYLELPASVPARVRDLARSIVAGKTTEYAKAYALQEFFYGPSFTYSLHPPSDGSGDAALPTFLFDTRTGYCQQFAGSYAVLARAVGLPTRLAIGFTTGRRLPDGAYQVTDADAHTWPEVWFPHFGWVPFEPTKGSGTGGFAIPGAGGYTGDTGAAQTTVTGRTPPQASTTTVPTTSGTTSDTVPVPGRHTVHDQSITKPPHGDTAGPRPPFQAQIPTPGASRSAGKHPGHRLAVLGAVVVLLALFVASNWVGRRIRWVLRRRRWVRAPDDGRYGPEALGVVWAEVTERLSWLGVRRRASETPQQFADRIAAERRHAESLPLGQHLHRLADILTEADFSRDGVSATDFDEADLCARRIASVLARDRRRTVRLRLLFDPRLAWEPVTVEPATSLWLDATVG
jgi:hypothetical protein